MITLVDEILQGLACISGKISVDRELYPIIYKPLNLSVKQGVPQTELHILPLFILTS